MLQECKYRLPCNWCDKYDRMCEAVLYEIHKEEQEKNVCAQNPKKINKECEHEWRYGEKTAVGHHYICIKCGTMKVVPLENLSYTDKECDHDWYFDSHIISMGVKKEKYVCNKCGEVKWTEGIWLNNAIEYNT